MLFGKHINRYYLKYAPWLIFGVFSLILVDYMQLKLPEIYKLVVNGLNDGFVIIDGKEVIKSVVYYIDGNEVGESSDKNSKYVVRYKIAELTVGVHNVTARCESNFKDVEIVESISSGTLTIEE